MVPKAGELMGAFGLGVFCGNEVKKNHQCNKCPLHWCDWRMRKGGRGEGRGLGETRSCVPPPSAAQGSGAGFVQNQL